MLHEFDTWSSNRAETNSFSDLSGAAIGIEASFYLDRLLSQPPFKEPLLSALGGLPFSLKAHIENELSVFRECDIKPIFIFDGMNVAKKHRPFKHADDASRINANAWELYNRHEAEQAVQGFGKSGFARSEDLYPLLLQVLMESGVDFQLAYLIQSCPEYIDAVAGSSELLLFDIDKVITRLDFEGRDFTFVARQSCIEELGNITPDTFVDACMLSGTTLLPSLPPLNNGPAANRKLPKVRQVLDMMRNNGQSGIALCTNFRDDPQMERQDYLDRYRRSRLAVKHQVVFSKDGKAEPFDANHVPGDVHEVIGQRLPDELYFYLSQGALGPRVMNHLTSGQIYEPCPVDGGDSDSYRTLVSEKLNPMRAMSLSLLSKSLTRAYQHRNVELSCWFDPLAVIPINISEVASPREIVSSWNVPDDILKSNTFLKNEQTSLSAALEALTEPSFCEKTLRSRHASSIKVLSAPSEIRVNTLWRFLHVQGYLDEKHQISQWGAVLKASLSKMPSPSPEMEEAILLAVELLKLGLLNSVDMFPQYSGAPMRGTDTDRAYTLLLSRIASLLRLRHKPIGFTGPLSRHLLAYSSIINAARSCNRDLMELCLVTPIMNGDCDRDIFVTKPASMPNGIPTETYGNGVGTARAGDPSVLSQISLSLPFLLPTDCGLGIAVKHYLDELPAVGGNPESEEVKEEVKERGPRSWFPHAEDFRGDLERAFQLWDAVYAGVKTAVELMRVDKDMGQSWDAVNTWINRRR